ncbi:DUF423 domain-containing protein [Bdellovibrionota bacterium FG-1]
MGNIWVGFGATFGFLGVALGAFGAHGLSDRLSERALQIYHTGAQYQMYHALALLMLGVWSKVQSVENTPIQFAGWSFIIGIMIFSGSLYALALTDIKILGAVTPIGGVLFLIGWISFAISVWKA